jgi:3-oxo-5-alpha-steroid 4-dehydrogenase 1
MTEAHTLLQWLQFGMIGTAFLTFAATMTINAPYGRYSASKGWGPLIPARFAWFLMECPNLVIPMITYVHYSTPKCVENYSNSILMSMFIMHYINRSILYPLRMNRDASPMPISVAAMALLFTSWNALMQSLSLAIVNCNTTQENQEDGFKFRFNVGIVVFFIGFIINFHADSVLLRLRQKRNNNHNTTRNSVSVQRYSIPRGGMFEYVSCANYFGEILEWTGFAIASASWAGVAFALYTFCNLGPRAYHHHMWYQTKFEDYEKLNRKAVIPFVL